MQNVRFLEAFNFLYIFFIATSIIAILLVPSPWGEAQDEGLLATVSFIPSP